MAIILNKPIITATAQTIKFEELVIKNEIKLSAILLFGVYNESGKRVGNKTICYSGSDFNAFWTNFNSGKFLFDELKRTENFIETIPMDVENDFTNTI